MPDTFLEASTAQPDERPEVSERLRKLAAYAMITVLEGHPNKVSMAPTLILKHVDSDSYAMEADLCDYEDMDGVFAAARDRLSQETDVEAYGLMVDSADGTPGFPEERPVDETGEAYPDEQPTMALYLAEADVPEGYLVIQPYRKRMFRGGATPLGAPLILSGPESLLRDR